MSVENLSKNLVLTYQDVASRVEFRPDEELTVQWIALRHRELMRSLEMGQPLDDNYLLHVLGDYASRIRRILSFTNNDELFHFALYNHLETMVDPISLINMQMTGVPSILARLSEEYTRANHLMGKVKFDHQVEDEDLKNSLYRILNYLSLALIVSLGTPLTSEELSASNKYVRGESDNL